MIYQQDWLMRQIEAMIQAILAVALGISANEQTATQIEDSSYGKMLEKMIDDGDICAAEDLLFNVFLTISETERLWKLASKVFWIQKTAGGDSDESPPFA